MPDLSTSIHTDMLKQSTNRRSLPFRLLKAIKRELILKKGLYGLEWGDPDTVEPLAYIKNRFVIPYINANHTALEIGPGGGRWTRYLLGFNRLYVIDYYSELLKEVKKKFRSTQYDLHQKQRDRFPRNKATIHRLRF